jgi:hypothetical protein
MSSRTYYSASKDNLSLAPEPQTSTFPSEVPDDSLPFVAPAGSIFYTNRFR